MASACRCDEVKYVVVKYMLSEANGWLREIREEFYGFYLEYAMHPDST